MDPYEFIRQRILQLWFRSGKLAMPIKHLHSIVNLSLLEIELSKGSDGSFVLGVHAKCLFTEFRGAGNILSRLEQG
jgi:hypothetical protein